MGETKKSKLEILREKINQSSNREFLFLRFKTGEKRRVRVLSEVDDIVIVTFHDSFDKGVNYPCYKYFGKKDCPFCGKTKEDGFRTREMCLLTVFDYDSGEVKIIKEAANKWSPIPSLVDFMEEYGTLLDRDYVVKRIGSSFDISYGVVPMKEEPFKGKAKYKKFTEEEIFTKLKDTYLEKMKDTLVKLKDGTF